MIKFEQFIKESNEVSPEKAIKAYCEDLAKKCQSNIDQNDMLRATVEEIFIPKDTNIKKVLEDGSKMALNFQIRVNPSRDLDEFIEILQQIKEIFNFTDWFEIHFPTNNAIIIDAFLEYKNIDKNVLKSYSTISRYKL